MMIVNVACTWVRQSLMYASEVPVADWRLLLCVTPLGDNDHVSNQLNTISSEAAAPTAPATVTASHGSDCAATTPARIMAAPWPSCIPAIASPNACHGVRRGRQQQRRRSRRPDMSHTDPRQAE